jgi:predicted dehydrogenase
LADGFGFSMRYTVNFENATADFDLARKDPLLLTTGGKTASVDAGPGHGYEPEVRYFVDCVAKGKKPAIVTADDGLQSVEIIEAEVESVRTGQTVKL